VNLRLQGSPTQKEAGRGGMGERGGGKKKKKMGIQKGETKKKKRTFVRGREQDVRHSLCFLDCVKTKGVRRTTAAKNRILRRLQSGKTSRNAGFFGGGNGRGSCGGNPSVGGPDCFAKKLRGGPMPKRKRRGGNEKTLGVGISGKSSTQGAPEANRTEHSKNTPAFTGRRDARKFHNFRKKSESRRGADNF